jgi:hypothetical protein
MIPSTKTHLLVAESWTKIYQSFRNADFQSYDFDTLRRTMITYLRETYPEEFNDYIDSSEYIALVDLIAFLGQNLSFRIDLNARENFLETAQRQDSVLRLAQLISYNPARNVPAHGILKLSAVSTSEDVIDTNGINLANQVIGWNDPSNINWYQQFVSIMNAAMPGNTMLGRPDASAIIDGISTDQYSVNSAGQDVPAYTITKAINGTPMTFEISGATFNGRDYIYENTPLPGTNFKYVFQNDNQGAGSANTGFFVHFRQGKLSSTTFNVTNPVANEIIGINASGINNTDVWLWQLDGNGNYSTLWTKVDALVGNNVIYNNVKNGIRTLYSVTTRANDQIDLNFADGSFGDLPNGNFVLFYRQSNGQTYTITPDQLAGITVTVPYINKAGNTHKLTLTLTLQYTVTNSAGTETLANIKTKAPQNYYLQNRMITAEDYNIGPLMAGSNILKVKSINRIASGISKYFELSDISGKYSNTDIFAKDGMLYRENKTPSFNFSFTGRNEVFAAIKNKLNPVVASSSMRNFYYRKENFPRPQLANLGYNWYTVTKAPSQTTGYFLNTLVDPNAPTQVGYFSVNTAQYISAGSLIKFQLPSGKYQWSKVIQVVGDGSNQGKGALNNGTGPIILSGSVPNGSIPKEVIPAFVSVFSYAFETQLVNLCMAKRNFGLSFDRITRTWFVVVDSNLDLASGFSLSYQGDQTNTSKDSSWIVLFKFNGIGYTVSYRATEYIFESDKQTAFFVDYNNNNYDFVSDRVIKDQIDVLSINTIPGNTLGFDNDYRWQIDRAVVEPDGYIEPKKVIVSFYDTNNDGQIDNPDAFDEIVYPSADSTNVEFIYFKILSDGNRYQLMSDQTLITAYDTESDAPQATVDGELFYFYDKDIVKHYDAATDSLVLDNGYFAKPGRKGLKFHYMHNAGEERRIDPSKSNIIDVYMLTAEYDTAFRSWLASGTGTSPMAPTSQSLENNFAEYLNPIKSISDTLVFHPTGYKILFGSQAVSNLQGTFKAVRNPNKMLSDNDLKSRIIYYINQFFSIDNWNLGQTFNFTELATYVLNSMTPDIINFVIVPKNASLPFGTLFQLTCQENEILISGATVDDIEIIDSVTAAQLNLTSPIITNTNGAV